MLPPTRTFCDTWAAFVAAGLSVSGREVTFENGVTLLIGDTNERGGLCGCGDVVDPDAVVMHYRDLVPVHN
jgi:hypothetical protein